MKISYCFGSCVVDVFKLLKDRENIEREDAEAVLLKTGPEFLKTTTDYEDTLSMSLNAVDELITQLSQDELLSVSSIVSVTETPRYQFPGNSYWIKDRINKNIDKMSGSQFCMDLNSGCTGFVDALYMVLTMGKPAIIVCSEVYSKHNEYLRSTSSLFSDAASACYIDPKNYTIQYFDYFSCADNDLALGKGYGEELTMVGKDVFNFVVTSCVPRIRNLLNLHQDLSRVYMHQGSKLIVDFIKKKFKTENINMPTHVEKYGNQVSATIPILVKDDTNSNSFQCGEKIGLVGFGVGLSYSALVLEIKSNG